MVAEFGCALRRADDVGKQHRRQDAVRLDLGSRPGQKLRDLIGEAVGKLDVEDPVILSWQFDVAGTKDVFSEIPPGLNTDPRVPGSM